MSASRSASNSPLRGSSHRSAASPSSPDDRQLARARLFLPRKRRTPTAPSSAARPQQIALNDPLEASRAATAASLSSDPFRHRESISSCLPFSTLTQPALVLFPNQIRIYSQQAPRFVTSIVGFESIKNPYRSPQANAFCERLIASARRECLDFVIPLNESHIRMILKLWVAHFNRGRPHSSLGPGIPEPSFPKVPLLNKRHHIPDHHRVSAIPVLGGLHHEYKLEKIAA